MLRGTVYTIRDHGDGVRTITRKVVSVETTNVEAFKAGCDAAAAGERSSPYRVEFGSIGPPWHFMGGGPARDRRS